MTPEQKLVADVLRAAIDWNSDLGPVEEICETLSEAVQRLNAHISAWEWTPALWQDVNVGDKVRAPGTTYEDTVTGWVPLEWHVDPESSEYRPRTMLSASIGATLEKYGQMYVRPDAAVEIWRPRSVSDEQAQRAVDTLAEQFDLEML